MQADQIKTAETVVSQGMIGVELQMQQVR